MSAPGGEIEAAVLVVRDLPGLEWQERLLAFDLATRLSEAPTVAILVASTGLDRGAVERAALGLASHALPESLARLVRLVVAEGGAQ